jgi:hypothetical protein
MNVTAINLYVRDLTGVYSTDVISDTLLNRWINESYRELARLQTWPWLPVTDLSAGTDVPAFDAEYHHVLSYRAAVRVLRFQADDTQRGEAYIQEYQAIVQDMLKAYLPALASALSGTRAQLRRLCRDLTGVYDNSLSDAMINMMLNDSYNELAVAKDWDWLEANIEVPVPAFVSDKHTINLTNGTRRVLEAYLVSPDDSFRAMIQVPHLADVAQWDNNVKYDVTVNGVLTFKPEQEPTDVVRVRYLTANVELATETDVPAFLPQFHKILAYRTAVKILSLMGGEDARTSLYGAEYQAMFESMVSLYELDHDTNVIQMGRDGLNFRSYIAWFKPA